MFIKKNGTQYLLRMSAQEYKQMRKMDADGIHFEIDISKFILGEMKQNLNDKWQKYMSQAKELFESVLTEAEYEGTPISKQGCLDNGRVYDRTLIDPQTRATQNSLWQDERESKFAIRKVYAEQSAKLSEKKKAIKDNPEYLKDICEEWNKIFNDSSFDDFNSANFGVSKAYGGDDTGDAKDIFLALAKNLEKSSVQKTEALKVTEKNPTEETIENERLAARGDMGFDTDEAARSLMKHTLSTKTEEAKLELDKNPRKEKLSDLAKKALDTSETKFVATKKSLDKLMSTESYSEEMYHGIEINREEFEKIVQLDPSHAEIVKHPTSRFYRTEKRAWMFNSQTLAEIVYVKRETKGKNPKS